MEALNAQTKKNFLFEDLSLVELSSSQSAVPTKVIFDQSALSGIIGIGLFPFVVFNIINKEELCV